MPNPASRRTIEPGIDAPDREAAARSLWRVRRQWMERHGNCRFTPDGARRSRLDAVESALEAAFKRGIDAIGLGRLAEANALDIRLVELELPLPGLPAAFDGYRILHVSDSHLDNMPAIADLAGDGLKEVIWVDPTTLKLFVWNVAGTPGPEIADWPMYQHDPKHSNVLPVHP